MKLLLPIFYCLLSCCAWHTSHPWPVPLKADNQAVETIASQVKFTGSGIRLTYPEKVLLTFLNDADNLTRAAGKKNFPGSHQWAAAEIYRVDPGKQISVLCENGYQQTAVYFHYDANRHLWLRVKHLGQRLERGKPIVKVLP